MSCPACAAAASDPTVDIWRNGCYSCQTRAFAALGSHIESQQIGALTPSYRNALERVFGERWKEAHQSVKAWGEKIKAATRRSAASQKLEGKHGNT